MFDKVRVRFAPSPTGGLHLGGVRTALFNYLFARQRGGDFILRIEDTDQGRFVPGAEEYILECLEWCGITPDEGPGLGGKYGPYRQSERRSIYRQYAEQLVKDGHAYYAFDTPKELEGIREDMMRKGVVSPQYSRDNRELMRNSYSLPASEVKALLAHNTPYVIRIAMPPNEEVTISDLIRGNISFETDLVDDKVLLKADGMPTYHLAVVVDDYLMGISHVMRGEEWLPSSPVHILLWKYLGWESQMPVWAHLPLILKPEGNGKLSKRDGDLLGFPVNAMNWTDPQTLSITKGFRETGFLPEAFVNMLALLGWNDASEHEIFTLQELTDKFRLERVHKGGAKFDYNKAKWFNHEWIKRFSVEQLIPGVIKVLSERDVPVPDTGYLEKVIVLLRDRCQLLDDFYDQGKFFFKAPVAWDIAAIASKWNSQKKAFFEAFAQEISTLAIWDGIRAEETFRQLCESMQLKPGELQLPLRIMLVGGKFGPPIFLIAETLGKAETVHRIKTALSSFP
jgi:glutamyl-tRNA synthetase